MFDVKPITSPIITDCGSTCLQMLLEYYGIQVPLDQLSKECGISVIGCSARDIKRVGNDHGLDVKVYEMSCEELIRQDRPAIIHWKHNHFCIFCGMNEKGEAVIVNPDRGRYGLPLDSFKVFYSGVSIFNGEPVDLPAEPTLEDKINALIEYMGLQEKVDGNTFALVRQVFDAEHPIEWKDGMTPINNAFYLKEDGKVYAYMNGEWIEW